MDSNAQNAPGGGQRDDSSLRDYMSEKIQETWEATSGKLIEHMDKLVSNRMEAQLNAIQQLKYTDPCVFRKKGNEVQYKHNERVLDTMKEANASLEQGKDDHAKAKLKEGMDLMVHRQKLIRLADKSELGWKVVQEYETHELASDSEDEKRILKAEARASRKFRERGRKRKRGSGGDFYRGGASEESNYRSSSISYTDSPRQAPAAAVRPGQTARRAGTCFACGKPGHWRQDCLTTRAAAGAPTQASGAQISRFSFSQQTKDILENKVLNCLTLDRVDTGLEIVQNSRPNIDVPETCNAGDSMTHCFAGGDPCFCSAEGTQDRRGVLSTFLSLQECCNGYEPGGTEIQGEDLDVDCRFTAEGTSNSPSPLGRLKACEQFWETAGAQDHVLQIIREGYKIPFYHLPPEKEMRNNLSALQHADFVNNEILSLLSKGCISMVDQRPKVVNPLTVSVNRQGKNRLILDLRHVNLFLFKFKFRCEDIKTALDMFQVGDYMYKFDIKSAYHHIEIFPAHREYLGFKWNLGGKEQYFQRDGFWAVFSSIHLY